MSYGQKAYRWEAWRGLQVRSKKWGKYIVYKIYASVIVKSVDCKYYIYVYLF